MLCCDSAEPGQAGKRREGRTPGSEERGDGNALPHPTGGYAMIVLRAAWGSVLAAILVLAVGASKDDDDAKPLVIGDTFGIESKALGEKRRINVYLPPGYVESPELRLPVLYMPDGGLAEDFLHIAGLVQVTVGNGTMRPFALVGIESTERRRDLTGPTRSEEDKKVAKVVGKSAAFRAFLRDELMPRINRRYRTTKETAIVGESFAGLFVVETFLTEPRLFDTYVAIDPSLWWDEQELVKGAADRLRSWPGLAKTLYLAQSSEEKVEGVAKRLAGVFRAHAPPEVRWHFKSWPDEKHATVFHPAALTAFRTVFRPPTTK
jgi:predicted alpha/beta superfamily hydrolase